MQRLFLVVLCAALTACGTTPAPEYSGTWKAVNGYSDQVSEIPLVRQYKYYALPIDVTVKGLLERWAVDSKLALDYRHSSDFSLTPAVNKINQVKLSDAIAMLNAIYEPYGITARIENRVIVLALRSALPTPGPAAASENSTSATASLEPSAH